MGEKNTLICNSYVCPCFQIRVGVKDARTASAAFDTTF